jgi:putative nucleotidyltransferase with HDIG domain
MTRPFATLVAIIVPLAALFYLGLLSAGLGGGVEQRDIGGIAVFVAIALLSEMMAVDFRVGPGGHQPHTSLAFLPFLGSIVLFAPPIAAAMVGLVVGVSQLLLRRNGVLRALYNISQAMISAGVASAAFHLIVGVAPSDETKLVFLGAFVLAAVLFFTCNILLASVAIAILKSSPFFSILAQVTGPNGSNLKYDLLASPIAIVPVLLYETSTYLGILVIVLPLLLINYSYVSKKQVIEANKDVLRALVKAIETRDPYTSGHSVRVATLAKAIARDLKLPISRIDKIEMAALLHDIGKIDPIFEEVLRKPYELTTEERTLIQTHAARGAELLESLESMSEEVVLSVRHHHEWFDGQGYPDGIQGEAIPLAARIIMLCDSVDAMLSDRPYRRALSIKVVYDELRRCAGTQFDPRIVDIVIGEGTVEKAISLIAEEAPPESKKKTAVA